MLHATPVATQLPQGIFNRESKSGIERRRVQSVINDLPFDARLLIPLQRELLQYYMEDSFYASMRRDRHLLMPHTFTSSANEIHQLHLLL